MKQQFTVNGELSDLPELELQSSFTGDAWLKKAAQQIQAMASLPDGWDGDGALRPDVHRLQSALSLLGDLAVFKGLPKPHINPSRNGGVQLEWEKDARYFEIELVGERAATYLFRDEDEKVEEVGELFEGEAINHIADYIQRVEKLSTLEVAWNMDMDRQSIVASGQDVLAA